MAKKEEAPKMVLERVYNVPLRKEFQKVASWRKTEKAVSALRKFISKHMKSDNVILGNYVNQKLWQNGIKNPPHHVKVNAQKDEKGRVSVELVELPGKAKRELEELKKEDKKKEEKKKEEEAKAKEAEKKPEEKAPETKDEKAKVEEKEELKEIKKEMPKQAPQPLAAPKQVEQRPTAPKGQ
tara:strand:+ start:53 stop:598 length:546 start_codon:yes stop_codon:yes gene_type:complete